MIEVGFTLRNDDGTFAEEVTRTLPRVPAVGEMLAVPDSGRGRSYQVIDVLWNLWPDGSTSATVRANELDWHTNLSDVEDAWRAAHQ